MKKLITYICGGIVLFAAHACAMQDDDRLAILASSSAPEVRIVAAPQAIEQFALVPAAAGYPQQRLAIDPFAIHIGPVTICPRDGANALVCGTMWLANLANRNGWFTRAWAGARRVGESVRQTVRRYPVISGVVVATLAGAAVTTMGYAHS